MKFQDHKEFFDGVGDESISTEYHCEESSSFTVEEMYQHFKARMIEESAPVENKGMVLVDAGVINHAIHNIRNKLRNGDASLHGMTVINEALKIIESQLK